MQKKGSGYGFFFVAGTNEAVRFNSDLKGFEKKELLLIFDSEFYISNLILKFSYTTKNILSGMDRSFGILSPSVVLNGF